MYTAAPAKMPDASVATISGITPKYMPYASLSETFFRFDQQPPRTTLPKVIQKEFMGAPYHQGPSPETTGIIGMWAEVPSGNKKFIPIIPLIRI
jgi:hypothetical protein